MSKDPFLSICILTYNRKTTLQKALESILLQVETVDDFEVVVSDNASEDGTDRFMRDYVSLHPKVRYYRNEVNSGFDGNVVKSLERACGEYVALFSDDDVAPAGYFHAIAERLRLKKPTILYVNHQPLSENLQSDIKKWVSPIFYKEYSDGAEYITSVGLGFISSLILRRQQALLFLNEVNHGAGCAHLDIAFSMALSCPGPFIYDGNIGVFARRDEGGGCILIQGCVNIAKLYKRLLERNLIPRPLVDRWIGQQLMNPIPKHVLHSRARGRGEYPLMDMMKLYGQYWQFYVLVAPIYLIPHWVCRCAYFLRKAILSKRS